MYIQLLLTLIYNNEREVNLYTSIKCIIKIIYLLIYYKKTVMLTIMKIFKF